MSHLNGFFDPFPFFLLWSTAAAFFVGGAWLHHRFFNTGFTRAQEGAQRREGRTRSRLVDRLLSRGTPQVRELVAKEIRVFFRDATQWSQLLLLGVLVVVYVYNIKVLPLYTGEQVSFFLINAVSFLNLGLAGFVVAAIAARFVFPGMSLEGRMTWLLRSSPLDIRTLFLTKYWVGTVPLLLVALPLIVITNIILEATTLILVITTVAMIGITLAITALALGFGALYPNYDTDNTTTNGNTDTRQWRRRRRMYSGRTGTARDSYGEHTNTVSTSDSDRLQANQKKTELIHSFNNEWKDIYEGN